MGKWLAAFRAEVGSDPLPSPRADSANSADRSAFVLLSEAIGTNGTIGTGVESKNGYPTDEQDARDDFEELAARLEFQGGMSRAAAERQARAGVFGPGATVWTLDPTRRAARPLSDDEVDALLRDRRLNS